MKREKHPLAGTPVELTSGPHKGKYFVVTDWLQNQFQGKSMEGIAKAHPELTNQVTERFDLDDKIVIGRVYPHKDIICVHDSDMYKLSKSEERRINLQIIDGGKDDTGTTTTGDSESTDTGGQEPEGRSVSSTTQSDQEGGGDSETKKATRSRRGKGGTAKDTSKSEA